LLIAATGILFAPLGVWLAQQLDTRILSAVFAIVLVWVAYKSFKESMQAGSSSHPEFEPPCIRSAESGRFIWTTKCAGRLSLAGTVAGLLSGLLGVGGGFVMVPALQRYTDLEMKSVVATSLAVIALISLTGVITSMYSGHFNYGLGAPFAGGAVAGMLMGSTLSSSLPARHLKSAFGFICLLVAVGMVWKVL
jgi:uncharacterized membrane protein YfcA